jgi:hypothetical protein
MGDKGADEGQDRQVEMWYVINPQSCMELIHVVRVSHRRIIASCMLFDVPTLPFVSSSIQESEEADQESTSCKRVRAVMMTIDRFGGCLLT